MKAIIRLLLLGALFPEAAALRLQAAATYTDGSATFTVTMQDLSGEYSARVDAFWVTDATGRFIQNVRKDAANRQRYLIQWTNFNNNYTAIDGYSGATISSSLSTPVTVTWDCRDTNNAVAPDGLYRFYVEFTDRNGQGPWTTNGIAFYKGLTNVNNAYPDQQYIKSIRATYTPVLAYDVAVTGLFPPVGTPDTAVTVVVGVTNKTSMPETFSVTLSNLTTASDLGVVEVAGMAGNTASNVTFTWNTAGLAVGPYSLRAVASAVAGETLLDDNEFTGTVTLRPPTHDVAIASLVLPPEVRPNMRTNVTVVVTNKGDLSESFQVTLTDETEARTLGTNQVTGLAALGGANVLFSWDTTNAAWGGHTLRATAAAVPLETSLADNTAAVVASVIPAAVTNLYLARSNVWFYNDKGTNLGTAWRGTNYDDTAWASGRGPLGYGDAPTNTVLSYGPSSSSKYPTYYFRAGFDVETAPTSLLLRLRRDDGAVVYHNGVEIYRVNITNNPVLYTSWASATVGGADETTYFQTNLSATNIVLGANLLAVEVHQSDAESSDLSFDLELLGVVQPRVPTHDVAIRSLTAPVRALPGTRTNITVSVTNKGTFAETFTVELVDETDGLTLGASQVNSLSTNSATNVIFPWDTPLSPWINHRLRAVAGPVTNEAAVGDNTNFVTVLVSPVLETNTLIARRSAWRYNDTGADLTLAPWKQLDYYDAVWGLGNGPFGYGDAVTTTNSYGPSDANKHPAYYFRRLFNIDVPPTSLLLRLRKDDGAVVYHNGVEIYRTNIVADPVTYATWASATVDGASETNYFETSLPLTNAIVGTNVLAVEVHQVSPTSSDMSFDLELLGVNPLTPRVHEVAVLQVQPLDGAAVGDRLRVSVLVTNKGNASEAFTVYLRDTNHNQVLAVASMTSLAAGANANLMLEWKTAAAAAGAHFLQAYVVRSGQTNFAGMAGAPVELAPNGIGLQASPALGSLGGRCGAVAASGNLLFTGAGATLEVWDRANPAAPRKIGQTRLPAVIESLAATNTFAFAACGSAGVQFVDVSNPAAPAHRNSYDTSGHVYDLALGGNHLYVADGVGGLRVVDVTSPANPILAGAYYTEGPAQRVFVAGTRAYVLDGHKGLLILNVALPSSPLLLGFHPGLDDGQGLCVAGSTAYAVDSNNRFLAIGVAAPASPTLLGSLLLPGAVGRAIALSGATAYVPAGNAGLLIIDCSTPAAPALLGTLPTPDEAADAALAGNHLYLAGGFHGLQAYDVSTPASPALVNEAPTAIRACEVVVSNGLACVAAGEGGLRLYSVTNPTAPVWIGWFAGATNARCVAVSGATACVGDGQYGLKLVDLSNPAVPGFLGGWSGTNLDSIRRVGVSGSQALATDGRQVCLFDVSVASNPTLTAVYRPPSFVFDMAVTDARAYLACGAAGFVVLDLAAGSLVQRSVTDTPGLASGISVSGNTAAVADGPEGWRLFDVSNPAAPSLVHSSLAQGSVYDVAVAGVMAALGSGARSAAALDITHPLTPVLTRSFGALVRTLRLTATGPQVYVAEDDAGLAVLGASDDVDQDGLPDSWEQGIVDASLQDAVRSIWDVTAASDFDGDGQADAAEYVAGTSPVDAASRFAQETPSQGDGATLTLRWFSQPGKTYAVHAGANLASGFTLIQDNIPGTPPVNSLTLTNTGAAGFYIITVR